VRGDELAPAERRGKNDRIPRLAEKDPDLELRKEKEAGSGGEHLARRKKRTSLCPGEKT